MNADPVLTLLHQPHTARPRRLDARRGVSLVLGSCDCAECTPDLVVPAWPGAWLCCVVSARDDHWRLDNLCIDIEVTVVDLENPGLRVSAPPGRRQLVVPFEFSGLSFRIGPCEVSEPVTVIGPEVEVEVNVACRSSLAPLAGADLRPGTTYLAVLEELCDGLTATGLPPSSAIVSERLGRRGLPVTPKAVDHQVDYLFRRLFPSAGSHPWRGYKRWALASLVRRSRAERTESGIRQ
jgi:hypothetical protein